MNKQYFSLYSFAVPVRGSEQSIICNLYNAGYTNIPPFLYELLTEYSGETVESLSSIYGDTTGQLKQYFDYLSSRNLGTFTDRVDAFPKMSLDWYEESILKSAIIQLDNLNKFDYKGLMNKLIALGCRHLELWCSKGINIKDLTQWLQGTESSVVRAVDIYLYYDENTSPQVYLDIYKSCSKVNEVFVMKSPSKGKHKEERVYFIKQDLNQKRYNKNIPFDEFIICIEFFTESIKHNPYYNNKVCIDRNGLIKNSLDHKLNFGSITDIDLGSVVRSEEFQELWYACNDKVVELKDSPYRYIWMNTYELKKIGTDLYSIIT